MVILDTIGNELAYNFRKRVQEAAVGGRVGERRQDE